MKVVVTGASGFVGSALVRAVAGTHETTAVVRPTSDRWRLADLNNNIHYAIANILDPHSLPEAFAGAEVVIHAAGQLGQVGLPEAFYEAVHVDGTRHVLQAAAQAGVRRVLHVSSPGVLGPIPAQLPAADETAVLAPSNPYERSKAAAERVVADFVAQQSTPEVVTVRPEFMYGPRDTHVLGLFQAVQKGLFFTIGAGQALCHPTFIDDAVAGMLAALEAGQPGEIYHICGPRPLTFDELGNTIAAELGVRRPWLRLPQPLAYAGAAVLETAGAVAKFTPPLSRSGVNFFTESRHFDTSRAQRELNFVPQVDLQVGVARTVAWYREMGWLAA